MSAETPAERRRQARVLTEIAAMLNQQSQQTTAGRMPGDLIRADVLARRATRLGLAASFLTADVQRSGLPFADEQAGRLVDRALALASVLLERSERSESP